MLNKRVHNVDNNKGIVWAFDDLVYLGAGEYVWMDRADTSVRIGKGSLVNNETTVTGTYIHTWGSEGGLSIRIKGVGGISFSD